MENKFIGIFLILLGTSIVFPQTAIPMIEIITPIIKLMEEIYDNQKFSQERQSKHNIQEYPVINSVEKFPYWNFNNSSKNLQYINGKKSYFLWSKRTVFRKS